MAKRTKRPAKAATKRRTPKPIVMLAQETGAVIVPPEELQDWEREVTRWASAHVRLARKLAATGRTCSWTISGSPRSSDDSDYD
jgi:hypothetical protein